MALTRRRAARLRHREPERPTFLLGMGAPHAGVEELHAYLAGSPQCEPGPHVDYHVLDSAGLPGAEDVRDRLLDQAQQSLDTARTRGRADGRALQRAAMIADPDVYFDVFTGLLARPGVRLTMDLTPDHALLDAEQLAVVRDGFERRGVRTVAAFVMRDPLERVVAHAQSTGGAPDADLAERVERLYADPVCEVRTRYDRTIDALDRVFGPGSVWFGFHERLLGVEPLLGLCTTCRIDVREPERAGPPAARPAPASAGLPEELARRVVEHYQPVYDVVADRFGLDDLARRWPSAGLMP